MSLIRKRRKKPITKAIEVLTLVNYKLIGLCCLISKLTQVIIDTIINPCNIHSNC